MGPQHLTVTWMPYYPQGHKAIVPHESNGRYGFSYGALRGAPWRWSGWVCRARPNGEIQVTERTRLRVRNVHGGFSVPLLYESVMVLSGGNNVLRDSPVSPENASKCFTVMVLQFLWYYWKICWRVGGAKMWYCSSCRVMLMIMAPCKALYNCHNSEPPSLSCALSLSTFLKILFVYHCAIFLFVTFVSIFGFWKVA